MSKECIHFFGPLCIRALKVQDRIDSSE